MSMTKSDIVFILIFAAILISIEFKFFLKIIKDICKRFKDK